MNPYRTAFNTLFFQRDKAKATRLSFEFTHHREGCDEVIATPPSHPLIVSATSTVAKIAAAISRPQERFFIDGETYTVKIGWMAHIRALPIDSVTLPNIQLSSQMSLYDIFQLGAQQWDRMPTYDVEHEEIPTHESEAFEVDEDGTIRAKVLWKGKALGVFSVEETGENLRVFKQDGTEMKENSVPYKGVKKNFLRMKERYQR